MLDVGRKKLFQIGLETRIALREGDAQALPFADNSFDAICIAFGIRNIPDRLLALKEMARTVRAGGGVAILELTEPTGSWLAPFARFHVRSVVPRLGGWLSGSHEYRYLQRSITTFPPPDQFIEMMAQAGLVDLQQKRLSYGAAHLFIGEVAV
jgi:demethylmenaquinone methyltransferase/2-methoxy-6-polyprenyl-1,4-benzoquinol methylase